MLLKLVMIGMGGMVGALARYGLSSLVQRFSAGAFPMGTLVVNCVGCLFIGVFLYLVEDRSTLSGNLRIFLSIGLLGAFTTFSTFGSETVNLIMDQKLHYALLNVGCNLILGVGPCGRDGLCSGR